VHAARRDPIEREPIVVSPFAVTVSGSTSVPPKDGSGSNTNIPVAPSSSMKLPACGAATAKVMACPSTSVATSCPAMRKPAGPENALAPSCDTSSIDPTRNVTCDSADASSPSLAMKTSSSSPWKSAFGL